MDTMTKNSDKPVIKKSSTKSAALLGMLLLLVIAVVAGFYLILTRNQIYTDKAEIEAPIVTISPIQSGSLEKVLVAEGQKVEAGTVVAQVSDQILRTKDAGIVISAEDKIGKTIGTNDPVIALINPRELRVVAHVDEDKGIKDIKVGELVSFTVDAFASKKYSGVVNEISQTARQSGVVFNISDQREVKQFDVKISFDTDQYAELKNGMSAKVTIFTK